MRQNPSVKRFNLFEAVVVASRFQAPVTSKNPCISLQFWHSTNMRHSGQCILDQELCSNCSFVVVVVVYVLWFAFKKRRLNLFFTVYKNVSVVPIAADDLWLLQRYPNSTNP